MRIKNMRQVWAGQRGFTLVELLVVIPIAVLVVGAASAGLIQLLQSGEASTRMFAQRQVQTAGYWVSTDGLQADHVSINKSVTGDVEIYNFPITLEWTDPEDSTHYQVVYTLVPMSLGSVWMKLVRSESVNGAQPIVTTVAQNLEVSGTTVSWGRDPDDPSYLNDIFFKDRFIFTVTATIDKVTETREYEVKPRHSAPRSAVVS